MTKKLRTGSTAAQYAESLSISSSSELVYVSGILADASNENAEPNTNDFYGNTKTQTSSILSKISSILKKHDLSLENIIQLRAFLVGTKETNGQLDFDGFKEAYVDFFPEGTLKPTRTVVQVVGLPIPGTLVEIDVIAINSIP